MNEQVMAYVFGLCAAIIAYFSKNFLLDQLLVYQKTVGRVRNRIRYHAGIITNNEFPADLTKPIREELRQLSCDLDESYYSIPLVARLHWLYRLPPPARLNIAAGRLIFLSNNTGRKDSVDSNSLAYDEIKAILGIMT